MIHMRIIRFGIIQHFPVPHRVYFTTANPSEIENNSDLSKRRREMQGKNTKKQNGTLNKTTKNRLFKRQKHTERKYPIHSPNQA